ncbi:MAG: D-isomer specific 2-hydroxyacid dehydrogenase NAD-binding protein, partial [Thermomicrobiales bacterium]|nr:D-isomer specific 2-hydroxyacid dehydrogenase NAD-binding protein [Thermomicrobiales bacterium]
TSPLEPKHVERIAGAFPDQIDVIFRPDLMPAPRYIADHGDPAWRRNPAQEREWHRLLGEAEVLLDFPQHEPRSLLELAPRLRWVQTTSAGVGPLVRRLGLQESDLIVTTSSGIHAQPLAEFVFAALLYHTKEIGRLKEEQRAHQWHRFAGVELAGRTMAIIGPGRIGRDVARVARAFRMRVAAMGRDSDAARAESLGVDQLFGRAELHLMLAQADCLVVCAPLTPETEDLLGAAEFGALKPGAVFVNIGRGAIVDEDALLRGLREGRIAFAALDVFREEPLPADSPFWDMPNVLINPHSASTVATENAKIAELFVRNLGHYLAGEVDQMSPLLDKLRLY